MIAALMILALLAVAVAACLWTLQDDFDHDGLDVPDDQEARRD